MFNYKYFFIIIFSLLLTNPIHAQPKGYWEELPPMPSKRTEVAVTLLNEKIYVVGGFTQKGITDQVDVWDSAIGNWAQLPSLPTPLHHTTISAVNEKLYVIGGFASAMWTPVGTVYEYNPKTRNWTEKSRMPTKRGALAASVIGKKIYVVGGANKKIFKLVNTPALEIYDPLKNSWKTLAPMLTPRDHLTTSSANGKLYAIGGRVNLNFHNNLDTNEVYDPKANRWTRLTPLPTKRSGITSQTLERKILVFGGESGEGTFTENESYDPDTNTWETLLPMPSGRHGLGSAKYQNRIHLFGGGPKPGGGGSNTHSIFFIRKN